MSPLERQAKLVRQLTAVRQEIREAEIFLLCSELHVEFRRQKAAELQLRLRTHKRIASMLVRMR